MAKKQDKKKIAEQQKQLKQSPTVFDRLNTYLEQREKAWFIACLIIGALFSILLFEAKINEGGDDSAYIERAYNFLHKGDFPTFQGAGYPMVLSILVAVFGLNIIALKLFSTFCGLGTLVLMFFTFRRRIPYLLLFTLLLFTALNHFLQFYNSQTYSEAFFGLLQTLFFYFTLKIVDKSKENDFEPVTDWKLVSLTGLSFLLIVITRNIAILAPGAITLYLLMNKKWKYALATLIAMFALKFAFDFVTHSIWDYNGRSQLDTLLLKKAYKNEQGYEDLPGFLARFWENVNIYISGHLYAVMGIRKINVYRILVIPELSVLSLLLFAAVLWRSYKRNTTIFYLTLYTGILCVGTFFAVQIEWAQSRLIIPYMPYLFLALMYGLYLIGIKFKGFQVFAVSIFSLLLFISFYQTIQKSTDTVVALKKNIQGDLYYGFTPDWQNYLKISKWCADSLPKDAVILTRKPSMSFIYSGGREFVGVYKVPEIYDGDSMIQWVQQLNGKYVILANIRANPERNDGQIVNTLNVIMNRIYMKHPDKFKLLKTIGETENAEVYEMLF